MGYIDQLLASAKRWMSGFIPVRGAQSTPDGAGITINPTDFGADAALRSAAYWACTRLISCSVASLPTHIFKETSEGKVKAVEHPLYGVLTKQPNPWMTSQEFYQCIVMGLMTYGNGYALPDFQEGDAIGLWPLRPERVNTYYSAVDGSLMYRYVDYFGKVFFFRPEQILHFRTFTLDGINGLAPLDYHKITFGFESAAQLYASSLYGNGGRPSGILEFPNSLQPAQKEAIRASWATMHGGPANVGAVAVLDGGVKYTPVSAPLDQLRYIEAQKFSVEQIARIFGVAPHLIGAATQPTYASVEQQSLEFLRYTIQPIVTGIESTIRTALLQEPYFYKFNIAGFERSDIRTRYLAYGSGRQWGFLSVNDIRDLEDMNRIGPEGDIYLSPLNMVPAGTDQAPDATTLTQPKEEGVTQP